MKIKMISLKLIMLLGSYLIVNNASALSLSDLSAGLLYQSASISWALTDANQSITITNYSERTKHYIISVGVSSNSVKIINCNNRTISLKKSSSVNCSINSGNSITIRNDGNTSASGTYQEIG